MLRTRSGIIRVRVNVVEVISYHQEVSSSHQAISDQFENPLLKPGRTGKILAQRKKSTSRDVRVNDMTLGIADEEKKKGDGGCGGGRWSMQVLYGGIVQTGTVMVGMPASEF